MLMNHLVMDSKIILGFFKSMVSDVSKKKDLKTLY